MPLSSLLDSIPYVESDDDRNAKFTNPRKNLRVQYPDGSIKRFNGAAWIVLTASGQSLSRITSNFGVIGDSVIDDRNAFDTLVNVTMQPDGGELDVVGVPRIASALVVPKNVRLNFRNGAYLAPDLGTTVTILGGFNSDLEKKFGGGGTISFTGNSRLKTLYPQWWGAAGDGVANDTTPSQAALNAAKTFALGAEVNFPAGVYSVDSLNLSNAVADFLKSIRITGAGRNATKITARTAGLVLLDFLGSNWYSVESLSISSEVVSSQCGILLARSATSQNCNNNRFHDVRVWGSYTLAGVISIAAESTKWSKCRFENSNVAANHKTFYSAPSNQIGVVSANGALFTSSNTDNTMVQCEFYAPYADSWLTYFYDGAAYRFEACTWVGGLTNNRLITLKGVTGSRFNGPISFVECHWEYFGSGGTGTVFWLDQNAGANVVFDGLHIYGGYLNADNGAFIDFDRANVAAQNTPVLADAIIMAPRGITGGGVTFFIYIYALQFCDISWMGSENSETLIALGFVQSSRIKATNYLAPVTPVAFAYEQTADALPVAGTFQLGQQVVITSPGVGAVERYRATTRGTLGVLNGGATTANTTAGSRLIVVSSAAGLAVGQLITIAGAGGGPYVIWNISGTNVTLGSPTTATVVGAAVSFSAAILSPLRTVGIAADPANFATPYSANIQINAGLYNSFQITPNNGAAFTIQTPVLGTTNQRIVIRIKNTFGVLGVATFGAGYKLGAAWVQPANGFSRSIEFEFDGANWIEINRAAADVAN